VYFLTILQCSSVCFNSVSTVCLSHCLSLSLFSFVSVCSTGRLNSVVVFYPVFCLTWLGLLLLLLLLLLLVWLGFGMVLAWPGLAWLGLACLVLSCLALHCLVFVLSCGCLFLSCLKARQDQTIPYTRLQQTHTRPDKTRSDQSRGEKTRHDKIRQAR
jgi:hypothetical protein